MSDPVRKRLRALPAVDRLAAALTADGATVAEANAAARTALEQRRAELLAGASDDADLVARARAALRPGPRRVINATGVVIHTNLGRAPLAAAAAEAVAEAARGYVDLELDLRDGRRGARDAHVRDLLRALTGAQDAMVVNNGAAAVLLAAAALGGAGSRMVVSRGELVEIGGGFRIPDVVAQAGADLVEVGTTNRTRLADYQRALRAAEADPGPVDGPMADRARPSRQVVLRVHQSNFRTVGFTAAPSIEELCGLGVPVIDDVGSGALAGDLDVLAEEPPVARSVAAGAAVVCFSGDKLLGGPQAGILVGRAEAIAACRAHPLARAVRVGRLPLAALTATLGLYRDPERALREIPVLAMLTADPTALEDRAARLAAATGGEVVAAVSRVGGGALPLVELHGPAVALTAAGEDPAPLAAALRAADPPVIARLHGGRLLADPRTIADDEVDLVAAAVAAAAR